MGFSLRGIRVIALAALAGAWLGLSAPAGAAERMLFTAEDDAMAAIVDAINREQVRIDISAWYLTERLISQAIVNAYVTRGVPVRLLGDRAAIFEIDPNTRREFTWLAQHGVPIRLRHHPVHFPYINHWKAGIFKGQNLLEFGSANWTTFELRPASRTNYNDETAFFTDDTSLVNAFLTQFDQMWADSSDFLNWPDSYQQQTGQSWWSDNPGAESMNISVARLEPDNRLPSSMKWSQGDEFNNALVAAIDAEAREVGLVVYRLTVDNITDALLRKFRSGVRVKLIVEPNEYRNGKWPEFELTAAKEDLLWMSGVPMKQRAHQGLTHMKTLVTSSVATNASSNLTAYWQRDHNYFVSASEKPAIHAALKGRFDAMWNDTSGFTPFRPLPPDWAPITSPPNDAGGVAMSPRFTWDRAKWAIYYDLYLGTSPGALERVATLNADLGDAPPASYSFTPSWSLQADTRYYWRVVTRTFATARDSSLVNASPVHSFETGSSGGAGGTQPPPPPLPTPPPAPAPAPSPAPTPTPTPTPTPDPTPTPTPTPDPSPSPAPPPEPPPTPPPTPSPPPGDPAPIPVPAPLPSESGLVKLSPQPLDGGSNSAALLQWSPLPDAAAYAVCVQKGNRATCDGGWWPVQSSRLQVNGLSPGTYYWQVMAITPAGPVEADGGSWWSFTIDGELRARNPSGEPPLGTAKPRQNPPASPNKAGGGSARGGAHLIFSSTG